MEADTPQVIIRGIDKVIRKDLIKHRALLQQSHSERDVYKRSVSYLVKRKRHFRSLMGGEKYDDIALQVSVDSLVIDLRQMSDKVKLSDEAIDHHQIIVDTLDKQLRDYERAIEETDAAIN